MNHPPRVHHARLGDGRAVRVLDWPGPAQTLLLLHPNGLGAGVFAPLAATLASRFGYRCLVVDLPGHGGSDPPATRAGFAFGSLAAAVAEALDALGVGQVSCVGGSLGGGVGILVDRARPGRIDRLVLCEAVAFDLGAHHPGENPMAAGARRRRRRWPSLDAARDAYARRPPLADLAPEALYAYLRWGTVADGEGVRLACDPEHEATIFEVSAEPGGAADAWEHLAALNCDAVVLSGDRTFLPAEMWAQQAARAGCPHHVVRGGHFFLHENTARGVTLVHEQLDTPGRRAATRD